MNNHISPAQLKAIHAQRRKMMDEDDYRALLKGQFGKDSTKQLSFGQAQALLNYLHGAPLRTATCGATMNQIVYLRSLLADLRLSVPEALTYFSQHFTHRPLAGLEDLTKYEANQAIKGVKAWLLVNQVQALTPVGDQG